MLSSPSRITPSPPILVLVFLQSLTQIQLKKLYHLRMVVLLSVLSIWLSWGSDASLLVWLWFLFCSVKQYAKRMKLMSLIFDWYNFVPYFIEVFTLHSLHFQYRWFPFTFISPLIVSWHFWQKPVFGRILLSCKKKKKYLLTNHSQHHYQPTDADRWFHLVFCGFAV